MAAEVLRGDQGGNIVQRLPRLRRDVADVVAFRVDDAGRAGNQHRRRPFADDRHGAGEFRGLRAVAMVVIVGRDLPRILQRQPYTSARSPAKARQLIEHVAAVAPMPVLAG